MRQAGSGALLADDRPTGAGRDARGRASAQASHLPDMAFSFEFPSVEGARRDLQLTFCRFHTSHKTCQDLIYQVWAAIS